jgi:hypothetical protein
MHLKTLRDVEQAQEPGVTQKRVRELRVLNCRGVFYSDDKNVCDLAPPR